MKKTNKTQKINLYVTAVWALVVFPLLTALFLAQENPIKCSITEMGFDLGYYGQFLAWGISIIVSLMYMFLLYLKESGFRKELKIALLVLLVAVDLLFVLTGACSDASPNKVVVDIHNKSAIAMFIGHFVVVAAQLVFAFFRNKKQAVAGVLVGAFMLITVAFCYIRVIDSDEFSLMHGATSLCEGYSFCWIVVMVFLNYAGNLFLEPTGKNILLNNGDMRKII